MVVQRVSLWLGGGVALTLIVVVSVSSSSSLMMINVWWESVALWMSLIVLWTQGEDRGVEAVVDDHGVEEGRYYDGFANGLCVCIEGNDVLEVGGWFIMYGKQFL
jgi:hypothetical protein